MLPAGLLLALCFAGMACSPQKVATKYSPTLSKSLKGYAYLGMLVPMHPLYEELRSLAEHIDTLRGRRGVEVAAQIERPWESRVVVGPVLTDYPTQGLEQWRRGWESGLGTAQPAPSGELPRDLAARLAWRQRQIHQQTQQQLRQAEAEESQRLAKLRAKVAEQFREERRNLGLDLSLSDSEAQQQAEERREEIWQQIEQQLSEEAKQGQARLERLRGELRQQEEEAMAAAHKEVVSRVAQRYGPEQTSAESAQQLRQMVEGISEPSWLPPQAVPPVGADGPAIGTADGLRRQAQAEYEALCAQQVARLTASKATLTRAIAGATRRAARRVAWEENIDLHLLPAERRHGQDMTDMIGKRIRTMWTKQKSSSTERGR